MERAVMATLNKLRGLAALSVMAAVLSACQISGPSTSLPGITEPAPALGPSGNWIGTDGVAISTFGNGFFTSYAADTGARLAEGTYTTADGNLVNLTLKSLVRGTTSKVNCLQVSAQQLNCTAASGSQFTLVRTNRNPPPPALPEVSGTGRVVGQTQG
jgi:hypothetical protein